MTSFPNLSRRELFCQSQLVILSKLYGSRVYFDKQCFHSANMFIGLFVCFFHLPTDRSLTDKDVLIDLVIFLCTFMCTLCSSPGYYNT